MDNGYGYGASIELERFTAAALQLDGRGAQVSPKTGVQDIEAPINWAVAGEGCGTDNVLNHPLGHV